jgi:imidazolonepropionase-like amidohydrolase
MTRLFALVSLALLALPAYAQDVDAIAPVTRVVAIENARIVVAPGEVIERGTVVVRDGRIEAVGSGVRVPYDARRVEGDSLTVYAAFISGLSHAGVPEPDDDAYRGEGSRSQPDPDRAGIQPQRDVRDLLDPSQADVKALREAGFGAAHVVPYGRLLPGQGALVTLGDGSASDVVIRGRTAQFMQFDGAIGVYPSTPMGVIAVVRQHAREASRRQRIADTYASGPAGVERPAYDPVHEAFFPVLRGEQPVLIETDGPNEIFRALRLADELGFQAMLAGLSGGQMAVEALRQSGAPLFVTMALPDTLKADSAASAYVPGLRTPDAAAAEAEEDNLTARRRLAIAETEGMPALLAAEGLRFGFATEGVRPRDVMPHLRRMIGAGLTPDDALAALTTDAADLLGASSVLGSVERGKIANLIVADGPIFERGTDVRMMIVDGVVYELEGGGSGAAPDSSLNPVGTWQFTVRTPEGQEDATLVLEGSPTALTGEVQSVQFTAPAAVDEARLEGDQLTVVFTAPQFGRITLTGTLSADTYSGTIELPEVGSLPFSATRVPD